MTFDITKQAFGLWRPRTLAALACGLVMSRTGRRFDSGYRHGISWRHRLVYRLVSTVAANYFADDLSGPRRATGFDVTVRNDGTIWVLAGETDEGAAWLTEHADNYVEPRYAGAILHGAQSDGLTLGGFDRSGEVRPLLVQPT